MEFLTTPATSFEENGQECHFGENYDGLFLGAVRRNSRRLFQSMNLRRRVSTHLIFVKNVDEIIAVGNDRDGRASFPHL